MSNDDRKIIEVKRPPLAVKKEYRLGDLKIETNGTPAQIIAQTGGQWSGCSLAVFVAVAVELDKRDQEIAVLRKRLDDLERVGLVGSAAGEGFEAGAPVPVENGNTRRIEVDAEEAERDYVARVRKVAAFFSQNAVAESSCRIAARVRAHVSLTDTSSELPNMPELQRIERWLDQHGGAGWDG